MRAFLAMTMLVLLAGGLAFALDATTEAAESRARLVCPQRTFVHVLHGPFVSESTDRNDFVLATVDTREAAWSRLCKNRAWQEPRFAARQWRWNRARLSALDCTFPQNLTIWIEYRASGGVVTFFGYGDTAFAGDYRDTAQPGLEWDPRFCQRSSTQ